MKNTKLETVRGFEIFPKTHNPCLRQAGETQNYL